MIFKEYYFFQFFPSWIRIRIHIPYADPDPDAHSECGSGSRRVFQPPVYCNVRTEPIVNLVGAGRVSFGRWFPAGHDHRVQGAQAAGENITHVSSSRRCRRSIRICTGTYSLFPSHRYLGKEFGQ